MMMSINPINSYQSAVNAYQYQKVQEKASAAKKEEETAVKETAPAAEEGDTFVKSATYKTDMDKVNAMKVELHSNVGAFRQMVEALIGQQAGVANDALSQILGAIDSDVQQKAQDAIGEDGYWGVEQTATRILDFAKALSGSDPSKIDLLQAAFIRGYEAAAKTWGDKLPEVSQKTYDRVLEGFQEWRESDTKVEEE
jgi:hypothetical protein